MKDFAALLGPTVVTGGALYQTCWAGYLLHGKILDFAATGNQRYRTFPMRSPSAAPSGPRSAPR